MELRDEFIQQGTLYARLATLTDIAMEVACVLGEDEMAEAVGLVNEICMHRVHEIAKEVDARTAVQS